MRVILWLLGIVLLCVGIYALFLGGPNLPDLPSGEVAQVGLLQKTQISITRRGSHLLLVAGEPVFFVESKDVNLGSMEGKQVKLTGVLEHNLSPEDYPVLVVSAAELMDENLPLYQDHQFGYRFRIPSEYYASYDEQEKMAVLLHAEYEVPVVSIRNMPIPADTNFQVYVSDLFPDGVAITVAGYPAWQSIDGAEGGHRVLVDMGGSLIDLSLSPPENDLPSLHRSLFLSILSSFEFDSPYEGVGVSSSESESSTSVSPASGIPCGGPAGILCPEGEYCNVTDFTEGIGRCERL